MAQALPQALKVALLTALVYAGAGALALGLAGPPGYASPLYPSAGVALAAVVRYGGGALPGVWLGAFMVNVGLGALRGQAGIDAIWLPLLIGFGAMLQAALGAWLVRRHVSRPLVLNAPRDILRFGLLGGVVACAVSPSVATPALVASGALGSEAVLSNWLTWWVGDTLGVVVVAPLVLTVVGRPREDWRPRRRTLGVPLVLTLALLALGMMEFGRIDRERVRATFERDVDRLAAEAQSRLWAPVHALQALSAAAMQAGERFDQTALEATARWWLDQPIPLQALGHSVAAKRAEVPALEAAARAAGLPNFKVFDRDDGQARAADGEVVAVRHIVPAVGNGGALGVNALSIPAAREAILAARDSGGPVASAGFALTQLPGQQTGVVIYQALYESEGSGLQPPADLAARRARFAGVVFVTLRTSDTLAGSTPAAPPYLEWCLLDADAKAKRRLLAGPATCEVAHRHAGTGDLEADRTLDLAGRRLVMHLHAQGNQVPGAQREAAWLMSLAGLSAAAMLGALLLTVTGHSRRTELAVQDGTAELRREMSERTQAQEALRESEARLRSILDHVPLGVMFLDPQGYFIDANTRLVAMLGVPAGSLRGRSIAEFVHEGDFSRIREQRRNLMRGMSDSVQDGVRLRAADGRELVARVSASALRDPGGRVQRMVGVVEDIAEHLRLQASEQALTRAEAANRAKSEFLSRMSHELRTPLNAMIGFAQLLGLDREPQLVAHQREWTQQIQRAGWHLLEMINETLDLARIESGAVQLTLAPVALTPLAGACKALVASAASQRQVQIAESIDPHADAVLADATRLKQVLTNLLSNAVKYNREGGRVTLASRRVVEQGHDWVEIAVADTGLGMNDDQMAALFQPYNRLGREASGIEGTGIGLVISRRLTELMGGTLDAQSAEGTGSIFTLRLPAAAAAETPALRYTDTSPAPYQQRLVHYVEDNSTNIEVMRGVLAKRAQVTLATSMLGLDGLTAIRSSQPDLVLLDMQLPDISGLELLRHLKQDDAVAGIPVVVVSADATAANIEQALTLGAAHYVTKPVDVARFLEVVDRILEAADTRWG
jgi:PAS domain S-box-containing protein